MKRKMTLCSVLLTFLFLFGVGRVAAQSTRTLYFPQTVNGAAGGLTYRTTFILFNLGTQATSGTLELYDDDGRRLEVTLLDSDGRGLGTTATFNLSIPAQSAHRYITDGSGSLRVGWARVSSPQDLNGSSIFQVFDGTGNLISEAGVNNSPPLRSFTIFHDSKASNTATGLALANVSATQAANLTLRMFQLDGTTVGTKNLTIPPLGHLARFMTDSTLFPETARTEGFMTVVSTGDISAVTLRVDGIQLTTIPVITGGRDIPVISSITPGTGPVGTTVTIDGQNLMSSAGPTAVRFGSRQAAIASITANRIITSVPSGASSGPVSATVNGQDSNPMNFTITDGTPTPVVQSLTPPSARAGADDFDLTVTGANFVANTRVQFAGADLNTTVVSTIQLRARVPRNMVASAGSYPVQALTQTGPFGGIQSNIIQFPVTEGGPMGTAQITSVDPAASPASSKVTIRGSNFDPAPANNLVKFNGLPAQVRTATDSQIEAIVPPGATTGPVTVTVQGRASNRVNFIVQPLPALTKLSVGVNPQAVAFNPLNLSALVTSVSESSMPILDLTSNRVVAAPSTSGANPTGIAFNPNTNTAYIANLGLAGPRVIGVVNLSTDPITTTVIYLPSLSGQPFDIALNPTTDVAVVTDQQNSVTLFNAATMMELGRVFVSSPSNVAINPITNVAVISNFVDNTITLLDMARQAIIGTVPVGTRPLGVAVNPATNRALVVNNQSNSVSVVDLQNNQVVATIPVGRQPFRVAINPITNVAVVTNSFDNTISIIDLGSNRVIDTRITQGQQPQGVAINTINNTAIVVNGGSNEVSIMQLP
jgi:YVTN family beta-propeller protein